MADKSRAEQSLRVQQRHLDANPSDIQSAKLVALRSAQIISTGGAPRRKRRKPVSKAVVGTDAAKPIKLPARRYYGPTKHKIQTPVPSKHADRFALSRQELKAKKEEKLPHYTGRPWAIPATVEVEIPTRYSKKVSRYMSELAPVGDLISAFVEARLQTQSRTTFNNDMRAKFLFGTPPPADKKSPAYKQWTFDLKAHVQQTATVVADEILSLYTQPGRKSNIKAAIAAQLASFGGLVNKEGLNGPANFPGLDLKSHEEDEEFSDIIKEFLHDHVAGNLGNKSWTGLAKAIGRRQRGSSAKPRKYWSRSVEKVKVTRSTISRRREGCIIYDVHSRRLYLAIPCSDASVPRLVPEGADASDWARYRYLDGSKVQPNDGILSANKNSKRCILLRLRDNHDFSRYFCKHIDNHDANAPLARRAAQNTLQVFLLEDSRGPTKRTRLFLRVVVSFVDPKLWEYDEAANKYTSQPFADTSGADTLVGVDRGTNSDCAWAEVNFSNPNKPQVRRVGNLSGRKEDFLAALSQKAAAQSTIDRGRDSLLHADQVTAANIRAEIEMATRQLRQIGKRIRGMRNLAVREGLSKLERTLHDRHGDAGFVWALESLTSAITSNKSKVDTKFKGVAAYAEVERFIANMAGKRGFYVSEKTSADGSVQRTAPNMYRVNPGYTSITGLSGFRYTKNPNTLEGRVIGAKLSRQLVDGIYPRQYKTGGRSWGRELLWDSRMTQVGDHQFPDGVVYNADVMAAVMIALKARAYREGHRAAAADARMSQLISGLEFASGCGVELLEPIFDRGRLTGLRPVVTL